MEAWTSVMAVMMNSGDFGLQFTRIGDASAMAESKKPDSDSIMNPPF